MYVHFLYQIQVLFNCSDIFDIRDLPLPQGRTAEVISQVTNGHNCDFGFCNHSALRSVFLKIKSFVMTDWCLTPFSVIMSPAYSCNAENALSRGFPNSTAQVPLLGNISNVPSVCTSPIMTVPVHDPSEAT